MNIFPLFFHLLCLALPAFAYDNAYVIMGVHKDSVGTFLLNGERRTMMAAEHYVVVWDGQLNCDIHSVLCDAKNGGMDQSFKNVVDAFETTDDFFLLKKEVRGHPDPFEVGYHKDGKTMLSAVPDGQPEWLLTSNVHIIRATPDGCKRFIIDKETFRSAVKKGNTSDDRQSSESFLEWMDDEIAAP
eukprot:GHVS01031660.1.p1 GENE.GHVS01031660.1~~GHVS01031660.1.p1  ORF type:complete len:186 (-),score=19.62 GHVS01031660.1:604-1161(-)